MGKGGVGWGGVLWRLEEEKSQKSSSKYFLLSDMLEGIHFQPHPPHSGSKSDAFFFQLWKSFSNLSFLNFQKKKNVLILISVFDNLTWTPSICTREPTAVIIKTSLCSSQDSKFKPLDFIFYTPYKPCYLLSPRRGYFIINKALFLVQELVLVSVSFGLFTKNLNPYADLCITA